MNPFEQLLPLGTQFELITQESMDTQIHFFYQSCAQSVCCPNCQKVSTHKHSRTKRKIRDLPISGKEVYLHVRLHKWFCMNILCTTKIFTETIDAAPAYQRNTLRVTECLRQLAFHSNCVQAAKLSTKLSLPVSHDTLLRIIYRTPVTVQTSPFPRYR